MTPYPIHVGPTFRFPPLDPGKAVPRHPQTHSIGGEPEQIIYSRGEPDLPRWAGRCKVDFGEFIRQNAGPLTSWSQYERLQQESEFAWHRHVGYTGPNVRLGDYYVRETKRTGTEHRQVVHFEVVGTGRVEHLPRSRFDRQARAA